MNARFDDEGERGITPPVVTNGRVYAGTRDGRILSWDAESGEARWKVDVGTPVVWQPVVSGGQVFVGCQRGKLVALSTEDPADDGWPMWGGGPGHNGEVRAGAQRRRDREQCKSDDEASRPEHADLPPSPPARGILDIQDGPDCPTLEKV